MSFPPRRARAAQIKVALEILEERTLFSSVPTFDHVVVVIEENKSPMSVIGYTGAPYINSLVQNGAYFTQSYGNSRPSQLAQN